MPDTIEHQLREILQQLHQVIRGTAQEIVEESTLELHKQKDALDDQLEQTRRDHQQLTETVQQIGMQASRIDELALLINGQQSSTKQAQQQTERAIAELRTNLEQQLLESLDRLDAVQQKQDQQRGEIDQLLSQLTEQLQQLQQSQGDRQLQLSELAEQLKQFQRHQHDSMQKYEQSVAGMTALGRLVDDTGEQLKSLGDKSRSHSEELAELRGRLDTTLNQWGGRFTSQQSQIEKLQLQLSQTRDHIGILNDQIVSQAGRIADYQEQNDKLQARLDSLEAKLQEWSNKQAEGAGFVQRITGWFRTS